MPPPTLEGSVTVGIVITLIFPLFHVINTHSDRIEFGGQVFNRFDFNVASKLSQDGLLLRDDAKERAALNACQCDAVFERIIEGIENVIVKAGFDHRRAQIVFDQHRFGHAPLHHVQVKLAPRESTIFELSSLPNLGDGHLIFEGSNPLGGAVQRHYVAVAFLGFVEAPAVSERV